MLISGWEAPLGLLQAELQAPEDLQSPALESIREELNQNSGLCCGSVGKCDSLQPKQRIPARTGLTATTSGRSSG